MFLEVFGRSVFTPWKRLENIMNMFLEGLNCTIFSHPLDSCPSFRLMTSQPYRCDPRKKVVFYYKFPFWEVKMIFGRSKLNHFYPLTVSCPSFRFMTSQPYRCRVGEGFWVLGSPLRNCLGAQKSHLQRKCWTKSQTQLDPLRWLPFCVISYPKQSNYSRCFKRDRWW